MGAVTDSAFDIPPARIADFCRKWKIVELCLFGSALRHDLGPDSDVDLIASFAPDAQYGLLDLVHMQEELKSICGREVDLLERRAVEQSENYIRRKHILSSLRPIYVA